MDVKRGCEELCQEMENVNNSTKFKNPGSKRASVLVSWKALRRREKLKKLEERLDRYRTQILDYVLKTMR